VSNKHAWNWVVGIPSLVSKDQRTSMDNPCEQPATRIVFAYAECGGAWALVQEWHKL
jgi:hypothetical protein